MRWSVSRWGAAAAAAIVLGMAAIPETPYQWAIDILPWLLILTLSIWALAVLPLPKWAHGILHTWDTSKGHTFRPDAYAAIGENGRIIALTLIEPQQLHSDSLGERWTRRHDHGQETVLCMIGDDAAVPSYNGRDRWFAAIPDDFDQVPIEVGVYEVQWVIEGVRTVTHRFEWKGQTTHTKHSVLDRMKGGLRSVLLWISSS